MKQIGEQRLMGRLAVLAAFCAAAACGGGSVEDRERKMEQQAAKYGVDADVSLDESGEVESVEIKSAGGVVGSNVALPDGFPDDIPIPASWNVMMSAPVGAGFTMQALSEDDVDTIVAGLRARMGENGWTEAIDRQSAPQMRALGFEKDDRMANFNIIANGATQAVQLATMQKP